MNISELLELHDSVKHDISDKLFVLLFENRQIAKSQHNSGHAYHVGYDQAIRDMQNWLVGYTNNALERKG